jgi:hypothetical protein
MQTKVYKLEPWVIEAGTTGVVIGNGTEGGFSRFFEYNNLEISAVERSNLSIWKLVFALGFIAASLWGMWWGYAQSSRDPLFYWPMLVLLVVPCLFSGLFFLTATFTRTTTLTFIDKLNGLFVRIVHTEGWFFHQAGRLLSQIEKKIGHGTDRQGPTQ